MSDSTTQQVEQTETKTGPTKFGFGQIGNATPVWATWAFRIFFYLTSTVSVVLAMSTQIPEHTKLLILEYTAIANVVVHGLSKMIGVEDQVQDYYKGQPFTSDPTKPIYNPKP